jgi:sugar lactone lactonase YvrE
LLDVYDLDGDMLFPEGVAFDPVGQAFFVGSLSDGSIHRITAEGDQSMFSPGPEGNWSTAGVKVDAERGRVWACSSETDGAMVQAVWVLDLGSGDVIEVIDLEESAEGSDCNDVALDGSGVAYVSDPPNGVVHRIEEGGAREVWATHADFAPQAGLGLNGLAVTPDGAYLVLAKFLPATLFRIAIEDPTDIVTIDLSGDAFTGDSPTSGADGIAFNGDALYVTFAEHVKRVDFMDAEWMSGMVTNLEVPGAGNGLSTCTAANGSVYASKSEVTAWVLGQEPELPFQLIRVLED